MEQGIGSYLLTGVDPRQKRPRYLWPCPVRSWAQPAGHEEGATCVRSRTKLIGISAAGFVCLAAAATPMIANAATQAPQKVFSVASFGAKGDGVTNAAPATNAAIAAAAKNGGGIISFGPGTFKMAGTVHLASNVTINVPTGSTITGSSGGYDRAESNPNDRYQDYGHSHFHNAMFYGNNLSNVTFTGG